MDDSVSAVTFQGRTFFSRHPAAGGAPHSSLTQLIQGIWETQPAYARAILRKRIHTTAPLSPLNWGMVKTAAQRVTRVPSLEIGEGWEPVAFTPHFTAPPLESRRLGLPPMELAHELATAARREDELYRSDRPVGCVLVGAEGELLAWAHNTNRSNRTLHAEVNLMQGWWAARGERLPAGAWLFTTLEPCRMCLGMLHECAPGVRVRYALPDRVPPIRWHVDCSPV